MCKNCDQNSFLVFNRVPLLFLHIWFLREPCGELHQAPHISWRLALALERPSLVVAQSWGHKLPESLKTATLE